MSENKNRLPLYTFNYCLGNDYKVMQIHKDRVIQGCIKAYVEEYCVCCVRGQMRVLVFFSQEA